MTCNNDALAAWVLQGHETEPEEIATPDDPNNPSVGHSAVLWWGVLDAAATEDEQPIAMMPTNERAWEVARALRMVDREKSYVVLPVVVSIWARNEAVPVALLKEEPHASA